MDLKISDLFEQCFPREATHNINLLDEVPVIPAFIVDEEQKNQYLRTLPKFSAPSLSAKENSKIQLLSFFGIPNRLSGKSIHLTWQQFLRNMIGWHDQDAKPVQKLANYGLILIKPIFMLLLNCLTIITKTISHILKLATEFLPLVLSALAAEAADFFAKHPAHDAKKTFKQHSDVYSLTTMLVFILLKTVLLLCFTFFKIMQYGFHALYLLGRMITSPIASARAAYQFELFNVKNKKNPIPWSAFNRVVALSLSLLSLVGSVTVYVIIFPFLMKFLIVNLPGAVASALAHAMQQLHIWLASPSIFSTVVGHLLMLSELTLVPVVQWFGVTLSTMQTITITLSMVTVATAYSLENIRQGLAFLFYYESKLVYWNSSFRNLNELVLEPEFISSKDAKIELSIETEQTSPSPPIDHKNKDSDKVDTIESSPLISLAEPNKPESHSRESSSTFNAAADQGNVPVIRASPQGNKDEMQNWYADVRSKLAFAEDPLTRLGSDNLGSILQSASSNPSSPNPSNDESELIKLDREIKQADRLKKMVSQISQFVLQGDTSTPFLANHTPISRSSSADATPTATKLIH